MRAAYSSGSAFVGARVRQARTRVLRSVLAATSLMLTVATVEGVAQERTKIARVGYLGQAPAASFAPRVDALRAGLLDLGYIEGRNLILDFRWADERAQLPQLAEELIRAGSEVIFAPSSAETGAALVATITVPVVFGAHADPVGVKHVRSTRWECHRNDHAPHGHGS